MGVDLGGGDVGVTKQQLDGAKIRAPFEQVSGEGVPENVRADPIRWNPYLTRNFPDELVKPDPAEMLLSRWEQIMRISRHQGSPVRHGRPSPVGNRHQSLSAALAAQDEERLVGRNGVARKRHQFGRAKARSVKQLEQCHQAESRLVALLPALLHLTKQSRHGLVIEDLRQPSFGARSRQRARNSAAGMRAERSATSSCLRERMRCSTSGAGDGAAISRHRPRRRWRCAG